MASKKIVFKSQDNSFTLMGDYFLKGEHGDKVIKMKKLETHLLPIHLEDLLESTDFCAVFPEYFYHKKTWYSLEEEYPGIKICIMPSEQEFHDGPFNLNVDYLLYRAIRDGNWRRYFGKEFTLFLPSSNNARSLQKISTRGIILSHIVPAKIILKGEPLKLTTLSGSVINYDPASKSVSDRKINSVRKEETFIVYIIDDFLPVKEPNTYTEDDTHMNEKFTEIINDYFKSKIEFMTNNLKKITQHINHINKKNIMSLCMLDSETSKLLRQVYSLNS